MGIRRTGREAAVKILYAMELSDKTGAQAHEEYWHNHKGSAKLREYANSLVNGIVERREEIDRQIAAASEHWPLERIPAVDAGILRLAVYEIIACPDVPGAVAINEAVELAKQYAGKESASFINGILGKILSESGNEEST